MLTAILLLELVLTVPETPVSPPDPPQVAPLVVQPVIPETVNYKDMEWGARDWSHEA